MVKQLYNSFWSGKKILVTGNTGFKGCWLVKILQKLGAEVYGVALEPEDPFNLFKLLAPWKNLNKNIFDIRNAKKLKNLLNKAQPQIVIHLAAQSLVLKSYQIPFETFDVNIMGSLNLLNCLVQCNQNPLVLIITSDKVYHNIDQSRAFTEQDALGGNDPYSASKAACEITVHAFAKACNINLATARAGNVIGGGDFAANRLLADAVRAYCSKQPLLLRHPDFTRPWQHVLDVLFNYLYYLEQLSDEKKYLPRSFNFGPEGISLSVEETIMIFAKALGGNLKYKIISNHEYQEAKHLNLDTSAAQNILGISNALSQQESIIWTAEWYRQFYNGTSASTITKQQIEKYWETYGNR